MSSGVSRLKNSRREARRTKGHSLTPRKAKKILEDGEIRGKPLTEKQRKFFGAITSGKKVRK